MEAFPVRGGEEIDVLEGLVADETGDFGAIFDRGDGDVEADRSAIDVDEVALKAARGVAII